MMIEKKKMAQLPDYNLIPVDVVIASVINLENLNLEVLNEIVIVKEKRYLVSVTKYEKDYSKYLAFVTNKLEAEGDIPDFDFFSIQYSSEGVLVANTLKFNAIQTTLSNVRSRMDVQYRSKNYNMYFIAPYLDNIREIKQAITSLYAFPNTTFVIDGEMVANFVFVKDYFVLSYLGELNHSQSTVIPLNNYDFAEGTLIVLFGSEPQLIWNSETFAVVNLFPDVSYQPSPDNKDRLITGSGNDFILTKSGIKYSVDDEILYRIVYSSQMNYPIDHLSGSLVDFIPLKEKIEVSPTEFILSFSNVLNKNTKWKRYATLLKYTPFNTNYPFITMEIEVTLVDEYDDTFTNANGIIFKFVDYNSILLVRCCGLPEALNANKANITIADLILYNLDNKGINTDYDPRSNHFLDGVNQQAQQAQQAQQQVQQRGLPHYSAQQAQQWQKAQQAQQQQVQQQAQQAQQWQQQQAAGCIRKRKKIQQQQQGDFDMVNSAY